MREFPYHVRADPMAGRDGAFYDPPPARRSAKTVTDADEHARRVCIQSAVGAAADALLRGNDLLPHLDDHERLSRLIAALGAVADTLVSNAGLCLPDALIALQAEALTFSEALGGIGETGRFCGKWWPEHWRNHRRGDHRAGC